MMRKMKKGESRDAPFELDETFSLVPLGTSTKWVVAVAVVAMVSVAMRRKKTMQMNQMLAMSLKKRTVTVGESFSTRHDYHSQRTTLLQM